MRGIKIILVLALMIFTQIFGEVSAANDYFFGEGTKYGKSSTVRVKGDLHLAGAGSGEMVERDAWYSRANYRFVNLITGEESPYLQVYGLQILKEKGDNFN